MGKKLLIIAGDEKKGAGLEGRIGNPSHPPQKIQIFRRKAMFVVFLLFAGGCESNWGSAGLGVAGGVVAVGGSYEYVSGLHHQY